MAKQKGPLKYVGTIGDTLKSKGKKDFSQGWLAVLPIRK